MEDPGHLGVSVRPGGRLLMLSRPHVPEGTGAIGGDKFISGGWPTVSQVFRNPAM
jgi:hypothetical protein